MYVNGAEPDPKDFEEKIMSNKVFSGIIERLFVNKRQTARGSKQAISIANNKVYYGLGLHDKDTFEVNGVTLKEGMEVEFHYSDGKYKNVVVETLKIIQKEVPKEVKKQLVDKSLPIRLGNAISVANHFTGSYLDVVSIAKKVIGEVDAMREKMASRYPNMDQYSTGARAGQCVIIAAEKTKDINSFIKVAEELFIEICEAEQELREVKIVVEQKQNIKQEVQEHTNTTDDFSNDVDIPEPFGNEFDEDQIPF